MEILINKKDQKYIGDLYKHKPILKKIQTIETESIQIGTLIDPDTSEYYKTFKKHGYNHRVEDGFGYRDKKIEVDFLIINLKTPEELAELLIELEGAIIEKDKHLNKYILVPDQQYFY